MSNYVYRNFFVTLNFENFKDVDLLSKNSFETTIYPNIFIINAWIIMHDFNIHVLHL